MVATNHMTGASILTNVRTNQRAIERLTSQMAVAILIASLFAASAGGQETPALAKPPINNPLGHPNPPILVNMPPPFISGIGPATSGQGGVTIYGSRLTGVTAVMFGGLSAEAFIVLNDNMVAAWLPFGGTPGSTVPVAAIKDGKTVASSATYTYPFADMEITGPLPYDPQEIGDTYWYNGGGHSFSVASPGTLMFGIGSPPFIVTTSFISDSDIHPERLPSNHTPPFALGDGGGFSAILQVCSLTGTATNGDEGAPCTNWDGNTGMWLDVGPKQTTTLNGEVCVGMFCEIKSISGAITLQTAGEFDPANLARTFRIELSLQQLDSSAPAATNYRADTKTSNPFNAVVIPTALIQLSVLPYTILYQPPGDQSTVSFSTAATYGTNFSLGTSTDISNKRTDEQSGSTKFSLKEGYTAVFSGGVTSNWDTSTSESFGTTDTSSSGGNSSLGFQGTWSTQADPSLIPGSGDTCASPIDCSKVNHNPNVYAIEPFWQDTFILLVHPQFAVWVVGGGQDRYVMYGAVPVTADISVAELAACAEGLPLLGQDACIVEYTDAGLTSPNGQNIYYTGSVNKVTLSQSDAVNLLNLDPFYSAGQGAKLDATRAVQVASVAYGAKIGQLARPYAQTLTNMQAQTGGSSKALSHFTSVVDMIGSDESNGVEVNWSGGGATYATGVTVTDGEKTTFETDAKATYIDSTAISNQSTTTALVTLNDVDNTTPGSGGPLCKVCHDPLPNQPSVNIYLDRMFGSFMFQDPSLSTQQNFISPFDLNVKLLAVATTQEQARQRFSDVPNSLPAESAIGLLARTHIMTGYPDGKFHPSDPLTRGQLATILASALKLPLGASRNPFTDVPSNESGARASLAAVKAGLILPPSATTFGPNEPISRQEMATTLARTFKLTKTTSTIFSDSQLIAPAATLSVGAVVAAGYLSAYSDGTFKPTVAITRADAALALLAALKDRQLNAGQSQH
jgi:hypothetical protein